MMARFVNWHRGSTSKRSKRRTLRSLGVCGSKTEAGELDIAIGLTDADTDHRAWLEGLDVTEALALANSLRRVANALAGECDRCGMPIGDRPVGMVIGAAAAPAAGCAFCATEKVRALGREARARDDLLAAYSATEDVLWLMRHTRPVRGESAAAWESWRNVLQALGMPREKAIAEMEATDPGGDVYPGGGF